jgi:hypothetical protein
VSLSVIQANSFTLEGAKLFFAGEIFIVCAQGLHGGASGLATARTAEERGRNGFKAWTHRKRRLVQWAQLARETDRAEAKHGTLGDGKGWHGEKNGSGVGACSQAMGYQVRTRAVAHRLQAGSYRFQVDFEDEGN